MIFIPFFLEGSRDFNQFHIKKKNFIDATQTWTYFTNYSLAITESCPKKGQGGSNGKQL